MVVCVCALQFTSLTSLQNWTPSSAKQSSSGLINCKTVVVAKASGHKEWAEHKNIFDPPQKRFSSCKPQWRELQSTSTDNGRKTGCWRQWPTVTEWLTALSGYPVLTRLVSSSLNWTVSIQLKVSVLHVRRNGGSLTTRFADVARPNSVTHYWVMHNHNAG